MERHCDYCGEEVDDNDECEPDDTGHCIACGLQIGDDPSEADPSED